MFHHKSKSISWSLLASMVIQAHAYTNSLFCIASARAGVDDGKHTLIPGSMIVDPEGHIIAESKTEDDELVILLTSISTPGFREPSVL